MHYTNLLIHNEMASVKFEKTVAVRKVTLVFGLMAIVNESFYLGK